MEILSTDLVYYLLPIIIMVASSRLIIIKNNLDIINKGLKQNIKDLQEQLKEEILHSDKKITGLISSNVILREENNLLLNKYEGKNISPGNGPLRYKDENGVFYYHGIGHIEKHYRWWKPEKNHAIIEYKDTKKIQFPDWETGNVKEFCNNCIPSQKLNKNRRVKFYYICQGHKIKTH